VVFDKFKLRMKIARGAKLTYEEILALVEKPILAPQINEAHRRLATSVWGVEGKPIETLWRENEIVRRLKDVANEPLREMQSQNLKNQLLLCGETITMFGVIENLESREAAVMLNVFFAQARNLPDVEAMRGALLRQFINDTLSAFVLTVLGIEAYGLDIRAFERWSLLYQQVYKYVLELGVKLHTADVSQPELFTPDVLSAVLDETAGMFSEMAFVIDQIRHGIVAGSLDEQGFRTKFNQIIQVRDDQYRRTTLREVTQDDRI
jgi:hypothetical protein